MINMEQELKSLLEEMEARAKYHKDNRSKWSKIDYYYGYYDGKLSEAEFVAENIRGILNDLKK